MNEKYALGVDIGGSHIACQVVELGSSRPVGETYTEVKSPKTSRRRRFSPRGTARWEPACRKSARAPSRASA